MLLSSVFSHQPRKRAKRNVRARRRKKDELVRMLENLPTKASLGEQNGLQLGSHREARAGLLSEDS